MAWHQYFNGRAKKALLRDGVACHWCGCSLTFATFTIDHVVSFRNGGKDTPENKKPCCIRCNSLRAFIDIAIAGKVKRPKAAMLAGANEWMRNFAEHDYTLDRNAIEKYWAFSLRVGTR